MPNCVSCGSHYRLSLFNQTPNCDGCNNFDNYLEEEVDAATEVDIEYLKNPSGKVPARYSEIDLEDDSHGL